MPSGVPVDEERPARAWSGPLPRFVPLAVAAALLAVRLAAAEDGWLPGADTAAWGFGALGVAALVHLAALRLPGRYAIEGASWVATIIALLVWLILVIPAGGN